MVTEKIQIIVPLRSESEKSFMMEKIKTFV